MYCEVSDVLGVRKLLTRIWIRNIDERYLHKYSQLNRYEAEFLAAPCKYRVGLSIVD
jgi:hypothetical protein